MTVSEASGLTEEQFYEQFEGLDLQVSRLNAELTLRKDDVSILEQRLNTKKFMQEVLIGLKATPDQGDPGKYAPAFYFVKEIMSDDIIRAGNPSLYHTCDSCKEEHPVVMRYYQTYDSPEGDTWEKRAFIMCGRDGMQELANFVRENSF